MSLTLAQARALGAYLSKELNFTLIEPNDTGARLARTTVEAVVSLAGIPNPMDMIQRLLGDRSMTIPYPLIGTVVTLSDNAVSSAENFAATLVHECAHVAQIDHAGSVQSVVDYLGSGEMRAIREGAASAAGLWMRYVLTGRMPEIEDQGVLKGDMYHLDTHEKGDAREPIRAARAMCTMGTVPPFLACTLTIRWLRANAPDAIKTEAYR